MCSEWMATEAEFWMELNRGFHLHGHFLYVLFHPWELASATNKRDGSVKSSQQLLFTNIEAIYKVGIDERGMNTRAVHSIE